MRKILTVLCLGTALYSIVMYSNIFDWLFPSHWWKEEVELRWDDTISQDTINDSWGTWKTYFSHRQPGITQEMFMAAVANGEYKTISIDDFLALKVENHRLDRYLNAKTAEEAYPIEDRPRNMKDIDAVNYFLQTKVAISPITVARVHNKIDNSISYIKLDGVHRLVAAAIKKSPIKVLFIDL